MGIDPQTGRLYIAAADIDANAAPAVAPPPGPPDAAAANGPPRRRLPIVPGSLKLLFLDPTS
jgi:hypothetical protein